jgi:hypothetical protein
MIIALLANNPIVRAAGGEDCTDRSLSGFVSLCNWVRG